MGHAIRCCVRIGACNPTPLPPRNWGFRVSTAWTARRRSAPTPTLSTRSGCSSRSGEFDIILRPLSAQFQVRHHPTRAVLCDLLGAHPYRVLSGACIVGRPFRLSTGLPGDRMFTMQCRDLAIRCDDQIHGSRPFRSPSSSPKARCTAPAPPGEHPVHCPSLPPCMLGTIHAWYGASPPPGEHQGSQSGSCPAPGGLGPNFYLFP